MTAILTAVRCAILSPCSENVSASTRNYIFCTSAVGSEPSFSARCSNGRLTSQFPQTLYVLDPGNALVVRNKSFSVRRDDDFELLAVSNRRVAQIEIGEDVDYSRQVISLAMEAGIPLSFVDGFGQTKGQVVGCDTRRAGVQFAQAQAVMDEDSHWPLLG